MKNLDKLQLAIASKQEWNLVITPIITVIGMLGAAWLSAKTQLRNTKTIVKAEIERMAQQTQLEYDNKDREKRKDSIRNCVAELLFITDPEANKSYNYPQVVKLIYNIQILLKTENETELSINASTSELGMTIRANETSEEKIFAIQNKLIESCRKL